MICRMLHSEDHASIKFESKYKYISQQNFIENADRMNMIYQKSSFRINTKTWYIQLELI